LSFAEPAGSASIVVGDATGLAVGTAFWIDVGAATEAATVAGFGSDDVGGTTIILAAPLRVAHPAGSVVYVLDPEYGTFGTATVFEPDPGFGRGPFMWFNNVNFVFDFGELPFVPAAVEFQFRDSGGNENLSVNGGDIFRAELVDAPPDIGGVGWSWADPGEDESVVGTLKGTVERFLIGGQEFSLDTVCAYR
jgi:hypothetical protein